MIHLFWIKMELINEVLHRKTERHLPTGGHTRLDMVNVSPRLKRPFKLIW